MTTATAAQIANLREIAAFSSDASYPVYPRDVTGLRAAGLVSTVPAMGASNGRDWPTEAGFRAITAANKATR